MRVIKLTNSVLVVESSSASERSELERRGYKCIGNELYERVTTKERIK